MTGLLLAALALALAGCAPFQQASPPWARPVAASSPKVSSRQRGKLYASANSDRRASRGASHAGATAARGAASHRHPSPRLRLRHRLLPRRSERPRRPRLRHPPRHPRPARPRLHRRRSSPPLTASLPPAEVRRLQDDVAARESRSPSVSCASSTAAPSRRRIWKPFARPELGGAGQKGPREPGVRARGKPGGEGAHACCRPDDAALTAFSGASLFTSCLRDHRGNSYIASGSCCAGRSSPGATRRWPSRLQISSGTP